MGRGVAKQRRGVIGGKDIMDPSLKETLLDRLRAYLDGLDAADTPQADDAPGGYTAETSAGIAADAADGEARDLFSVFVEIAAARNEVRAQSRIVKDALDQFRAVFETLQSGNAALDRELKEAHARAREQTRTVLRPLLLDIIDVRDRLAAGLAAVPPEPRPPWWTPWRGTTSIAAAVADFRREGLEMTLRRLDRVLADRRVTAIATVGRPFNPTVARVVATRDDPAVAQGWVIAEARAGFEWDGELLRVAEVIVAKHAGTADRREGRDVE